MTEPTVLPACTDNIDDSIRGWANVLCLWRFCRNAKCAGASACRGADVRRCFHAHFILLPESVKLWFDEIGEAQNQGLSWEQAMERIAEEELVGALEFWQRTVAYSRNVLANKDGPWAGKNLNPHGEEPR
jgi:hypothetical protein